MAQLRIVTYNAHGGVGMDGRRLPSRQLELLRRIGADCIALQEFVNYPMPGGGHLLDHWGESLSMTGRLAACFTRGGQEFGNAFLSRLPIIDHAEHDMSAPGGRRRVALDVLVDAGPRKLHVVSVHCAVRGRARALQQPRLLDLVRQKRGEICVLLGDFNEWRSWSSLFGALREEFAGSPALPTFPAFAPVLPLDRIWVYPRDCLESAHVESRLPAPLASDHLPVVATVKIG